MIGSQIRNHADLAHATRTEQRYRRERFWHGAVWALAWVVTFIALGSIAAWVMGCSDRAYCEASDTASSYIAPLESMSRNINGACIDFCIAVGGGKLFDSQATANDDGEATCQCSVAVAPKITGLGGRAVGDEIQAEGPPGPDGGTRAPSGPYRE